MYISPEQKPWWPKKVRISAQPLISFLFRVIVGVIVGEISWRFSGSPLLGIILTAFLTVGVTTDFFGEK
jgi:hypothetical protein